MEFKLTPLYKNLLKSCLNLYTEIDYFKKNIYGCETYEQFVIKHIFSDNVMTQLKFDTSNIDDNTKNLVKSFISWRKENPYNGGMGLQDYNINDYIETKERMGLFEELLVYMSNEIVNYLDDKYDCFYESDLEYDSDINDDDIYNMSNDHNNICDDCKIAQGN